MNTLVATLLPDLVVLSTTSVRALDESAESAQLLACEAARAALAVVEDAPQHVSETSDGFAISGERAVVLVNGDGQLSLFTGGSVPDEEDEEDVAVAEAVECTLTLEDGELRVVDEDGEELQVLPCATAAELCDAVAQVLGEEAVEVKDGLKVRAKGVFAKGLKDGQAYTLLTGPPDQGMKTFYFMQASKRVARFDVMAIRRFLRNGASDENGLVAESFDGAADVEPSEFDQFIEATAMEHVESVLSRLVAEHYVADAVPLVRQFSAAMADGAYELAEALALSIAEAVGQLDEYRRQSSSARTAAARTRGKAQTGDRKMRNKLRRKAYKQNAGFRRKEQKRTKKLSRKRRSLGLESGPDRGESVVEATITRVGSEEARDPFAALFEEEYVCPECGCASETDDGECEECGYEGKMDVAESALDEASTHAVISYGPVSASMRMGDQTAGEPYKPNGGKEKAVAKLKALAKKWGAKSIEVLAEGAGYRLFDGAFGVEEAKMPPKIKVSVKALSWFFDHPLTSFDDQMDPEFAELSGKTGEFYVTDGKRGVFVKPEGYDWARYATGWFSNEDAAKRYPRTRNYDRKPMEITRVESEDVDNGLDEDAMGGGKRGVYSDYREARDNAVKIAKSKTGRTVGVGIEKRKEYGKTVYTVKFVPKDPSKRQGHELRMEIIESEDVDNGLDEDAGDVPLFLNASDYVKRVPGGELKFLTDAATERFELAVDKVRGKVLRTAGVLLRKELMRDRKFLAALAVSGHELKESVDSVGGVTEDDYYLGQMTTLDLPVLTYLEKEDERWRDPPMLWIEIMKKVPGLRKSSAVKVVKDTVARMHLSLKKGDKVDNVAWMISDFVMSHVLSTSMSPKTKAFLTKLRAKAESVEDAESVAVLDEALDEDAGDILLYLNISDYVKRVPGGELRFVTDVAAERFAQAVDKLRFKLLQAVGALVRKELVRDRKFLAALATSGHELKESVDSVGGVTEDVLPTKNEGYGFYGTVYSFLEADSDRKKLWDAAFKAVQSQFKLSDSDTLHLLDSKRGRLLADQVTDQDYSDPDDPKLDLSDALTSLKSALKVGWVVSGIKKWVATEGGKPDADFYESLDEAGIPDLDSEVYTKKQRLPKYNWDVSPLSAAAADAAKMLRQRLPDWTKAQHAAAAAFHEKEAAKRKAEWAKLADAAAQETWGRKWQTSDYKVSGVGSNEFSKEWRDKLRAAAHTGSAHGDAAAAHAAVKRLRNMAEDAEFLDASEDDVLSALEEAVQVDTSGFVRAHGKDPKGFGGWMFYFSYREEAPDDYNDAASKTKFSSYGQYREALKLAKKEAAQRGFTHVRVMESEDVEDGLDEAVSDSFVVDPDGKRKPVKNLGWFFKKAGTTIITSIKVTKEGEYGAAMVATFKDGYRYETGWADKSILASRLNTKAFRGVPVDWFGKSVKGGSIAEATETFSFPRERAQVVLAAAKELGLPLDSDVELAEDGQFTLQVAPAILDRLRAAVEV